MLPFLKYLFWTKTESLMEFLFDCLGVKFKQALFKYMGTFIKQRELTDIKNMTEIIVLSEALAAPIGVD